MYQISLRLLIFWLCTLLLVAATANSLYVGHRVQREALLNGTLEINRAQALQIADAVGSMLSNADKTLAYGARQLGANFTPQNMESEVLRLRTQAGYFNSVMVVDTQGVVRVTAPVDLGLTGTKISSEIAIVSLATQAPHISRPFLAATGRWIGGLSQPIFSDTNEYLGYVAGFIYLHESNVLHALLTVQRHRDGSYVYVVDDEGTLLYHPDPKRIGQHVAGRNAAVDRLLLKESGAAAVKNSQGIDMLAGYAPVPVGDWGIVVQRSLKSTLASLDQMKRLALWTTLPLLIVLFLGVWYLSALIARPLARMANLVLRTGPQETVEQMSQVRAWYFEAARLKRALIKSATATHGLITSLRTDSLTDPLTGAVNRRGLDTVLTQLAADPSLPFGVLALDLDHFKRVNDTYGHDVGDEVLKAVTEAMRENARGSDVVGRPGGEEFLMLLPYSDLAETSLIAERVRAAVQSAQMPHDETVTVSIGVSHCHELAASASLALKGADVALYKAKQGGRNHVQLALP